MADLTARLGSLVLPNPVLTASGCGGSGRELAQFVDLGAIGAFVTSSIMLAPRTGRPGPRTTETAGGLLHATGLPGPGVAAFLEHDLPLLAEHGARVLVSVAGGHTDEFVAVARAVSGQPAVHGIEINLSWPDSAGRGQVLAADSVACARVIGAVRRAVDPGVPILAKLAAGVPDLEHVARVCADAGADGFTLIDSVPGLSVDLDAVAPALGGGVGGLSGPAIMPIALRCVWQVHHAVPWLPIIGTGGIRTGLDALQFVLAGASAVAVGTAVLADPGAPLRVLAELDAALDARGFGSPAEAVGLAHRRDRPAARTTDRRPA